MELSGTVRIARPLGQVFEAWVDLERAAEYADFVVERRRLTDGPIGRGTRFAAVDRIPGRDIRYTIEIVAFEPRDRVAATWSDPLSGGWDAVFEAVPEGTELRFDACLDPGGLPGLLLPLLKPWAVRRTARTLARFRDWLEAG